MKYYKANSSGDHLHPYLLQLLLGARVVKLLMLLVLLHLLLVFLLSLLAVRLIHMLQLLLSQVLLL